MNACIIAVGSELLTPFRVDTNSLTITDRLNGVGVDVKLKAIVGDNVQELSSVIQRAIADSIDLIVCTGGLGPTEDDVTRDAVARVLGVPLDIDEPTVERIQKRFARRGLTMPDINRRQALVPRGGVLIDNPNGTAPGLWIERGRTALLLLPGPPREMTPMLDAVVRDRLKPRSGGRSLYRRVLRITGRTESDVDARAQPVYSKWLDRAPPIQTTILAVMGQIELHLSVVADGPAAADEALNPAVEELTTLLGRDVYSVDGRALEVVVGDMLRAKQWTISVAESCTGGLLASRLTDVPGSSEYVERGVVCYSNQSKVDLLGVPETVIAEHGAVSEPVALAMAAGIRSRAGTNAGIGITGIAGPGGGSPAKPVGTVVIGFVTDGGLDRVRTYQFIGGREQVKFQATQAAMNMLRLLMLEDV
jgi:nicotinamide-nucleotide amidase